MGVYYLPSIGFIAFHRQSGAAAVLKNKLCVSISKEQIEGNQQDGWGTQTATRQRKISLDFTMPSLF